ncbi:19505_t:CDS:2 [Entrophospora sp. SA101]|nr:20459_t:CDS:2 [Entrophospora sp. SA101]CAJ0762918.1 19505_t:CDS:2 [Entrophospora sp. SA101]CAJ0833161.1 3205_t:CDS:2 [Entrophospora sp. SA101]
MVWAKEFIGRKCGSDELEALLERAVIKRDGCLTTLDAVSNSEAVDKKINKIMRVLGPLYR